MDDRFQSAGKQVLVDGCHFADARSPGAADLIVEALHELRTKIVDIRLEKETIRG